MKARLSPRLYAKKVHNIIDLEISIFYLYLLIIFIPYRQFNVFTWFSTADIYMNIKSELIFYPWHSIYTHIVFFVNTFFWLVEFIGFCESGALYACIINFLNFVVYLVEILNSFSKCSWFKINSKSLVIL